MYLASDAWAVAAAAAAWTVAEEALRPSLAVIAFLLRVGQVLSNAGGVCLPASWVRSGHRLEERGGRRRGFGAAASSPESFAKIRFHLNDGM